MFPSTDPITQTAALQNFFSNTIQNPQYQLALQHHYFQQHQQQQNRQPQLNEGGDSQQQQQQQSQLLNDIEADQPTLQPDSTQSRLDG